MTNVDIVIIALIAGFIILRLRSVLGQNTGFDPRRDKVEKTEARGETPVLPLPKSFPLPRNEPEIVRAEPWPERLSDAVKQGLDAIRKEDPSFQLNRFLDGARGAFEMVLKAYHDADKEALRMLLSPPIAEVFIREAERNKTADERTETTLVAIENCDVIEANLNKKTAQIRLRITSEQISVVRDKDGKIIEGDPSSVERVEDEWTFERDVNARGPNWVITDT